MRTSLAFALTFLVATPALAQKEYGFDNRKSSGQPYWKPEETVAKFKVPDEFEVKLFAGEPQVVNPVAFTIDEKGRVWVVECFEYPKRTPKGKAPRDRIVILEDTDGDGVCDKRTVFAEGKDFPVPEERAKAGLGAFDLCTGIEVGHGGVFVGAAPYLWFIENKNDKPGKFEVLLKGFGSQDTHETLNTFQWGPDGWLYGLHGIFTESKIEPGEPGGVSPRVDGVKMNAAVWRYHPTRKKFEIFAEGTSNPWGMDWRNTDGQFILCCCVIPHLYHIVPGGIYKRQAGASFNPYVYGYLNEICDHTFHKESGWAHAGLISLDVPHMPERFRNSVIFGSIHGCSIKQNILKPNGSTYTASRGDDFLQSADKNFRPINMKWGPLGDIYVIDWHDQYPCHQTNPDDWDYDHGRVYRIQLKGTMGCKPFDLSKWSDKELLQVLRNFAAGASIKKDFQEVSNAAFLRMQDILGTKKYIAPTPYWTRTAIRLLEERRDKFDDGMKEETAGMVWLGPKTEAAHLKQLDADFEHERWMEQSRPGLPPGYAGQPRAEIIRAFSDTPALSAAGLKKLTELAASERYAPVRRELASAAIRLAETHDVTLLLRALVGHKEDAKDTVIQQLVWLAYEKVLSKRAGERRGVSPTVPKDDEPAKDRPADDRRPDGPTLTEELAWLAGQAPDNPFVRDQIMPRAMSRLVATGKPENLKLCVAFVAKLKDAASREKALDGIVFVLAGQSIDAPEGWAALQAEIAKEANPRLVARANKLAVVFRDPAALRRAVEIAANTGLPAAERAEAVRQLGSIKAPETIALLLNIVRKDAAEPVRVEAARALAGFDKPNIPTELIAAWSDLPRELRPDVINTLATRKEWAKVLLQAMATKKIERMEVTNNVILGIQAFNDGELNRLIEKAWGRTRATPKELQDLIDKTRDSLHAAPASFERGRKVFENNCAKCHKFEGKGNEVGPQLDGAARDIEYILINVLDPNRVIGAPYFVRTVRLEDDTVFQGLLAEEDDKTITLKLEGAAFKTIRKSAIAEIRVSEKSLMPEGLGYNMTAQDFRDLVRYLMAHPFVTEATVNGEKLSAGVPGRLLLPDTKGAPAVVEAEVTATERTKTKLLVGSSADYEVRLDGKALGTGKGTGKALRPDQDGFDVQLAAGKHTLTVVVKGGAGNGLHVRFLDPDRKLHYPEPGEKK